MVGIGFFAPLPLALMMPFMAGQSMLMGDAFGKAYQYGKRKISAMSNEEFNKLTPQQLGAEIATDYSAMIPSLQVAIKQSSAFQSLIIEELASIIRSLPKDIVSGFTGDTVNPISTIQHETVADNIDYGKIAIATLKIMLGPISGNFNIPGFNVAHADTGNTNATSSLLEQHINIQKDLIEEEKLTIIQGPTEGPTEKKDLPENIPSSKVLSAAEDPVYLAWITKLGKLKSEYQTLTSDLKIWNARVRNASGNNTESVKSRQEATRNVGRIFNERRAVTSKIRAMSRDYRDPNNHIRENALRLRREMQTQWK